MTDRSAWHPSFPWWQEDALINRLRLPSRDSSIRPNNASLSVHNSAAISCGGDGSFFIVYGTHILNFLQLPLPGRTKSRLMRQGRACLWRLWSS